MDQPQCFPFLQAAIPLLLTKLGELGAHVAARHEEFTKLSNPPEAALSQKILRRKTGSNESLRDVNDPPAYCGPSPPQGELGTKHRLELSPDNKNLFREVRNQSRRLRMTPSMLSDNSGSQRYRLKMSLIVYYDSRIQDSFEELVRNIATARNVLRKDRHNAKLESRMGGSQKRIKMPDADPVPTYQVVDSGNVSSRLDGEQSEAFEQADLLLESAQSLCEVGAHQFLRDGNCHPEVAAINEKLGKVHDIAKAQVAASGKRHSQDLSVCAEACHSRPGAYDLSVDPGNSDISQHTSHSPAVEGGNSRDKKRPLHDLTVDPDDDKPKQSSKNPVHDLRVDGSDEKMKVGDQPRAAEEDCTDSGNVPFAIAVGAEEDSKPLMNAPHSVTVDVDDNEEFVIDLAAFKRQARSQGRNKFAGRA